MQKQSSEHDPAIAELGKEMPRPRKQAYKLPFDGGWHLRMHTSAMLTFPFVAFCLALVELVHGKTKLWEIMMLLLMMILPGLGITLGYHRFLCHRAFKSGQVLKAILIVLGSMAGQGPPVFWVATHRRHHQFADVDGDPHSPHWIDDHEPKSKWHGLFYAHVGWLFGHSISNSAVLCRDLLQDRMVTWLSNRYYYFFILGLLLPALVGALIVHSLAGAWMGFVWGSGVRLFFWSHVNYSVNSISHNFGYRSFTTRDNSTNNLWLALFSLGEHWHNNHHACPSSAFFGLRWWEIDIGAMLIQLLERAGLVHQVVRPDVAILNKIRISKPNKNN